LILRQSDTESPIASEILAEALRRKLANVEWSDPVGTAVRDLFTQPDELSISLSLRQLLQLARRFRVPALSLLREPPAAVRERRLFTELAADIRAYCDAHHLSIRRFGEQAGWKVEQFVTAPDSALDEWCLDALRRARCACR
jgi:hypothetical protein